MAQLKCPECGKEFQGDACPNCGCPASECSVVEHNKTTIQPNKARFVNSSLLPGERILNVAKIDYTFLIILLAALTVVFFISFYVLSTDYDMPQAFIPLLMYSIVCAFGLAMVLATKKYGKEFAITSKRVIATVGIFCRVSFELKLEQVESLIIYQGLFGKWFKFGTIQVNGIGASRVRVRFVKHPFEFRQHFFEVQEAKRTTL